MWAISVEMTAKVLAWDEEPVADPIAVRERTRGLLTIGDAQQRWFQAARLRVMIGRCRRPAS